MITLPYLKLRETFVNDKLITCFYRTLMEISMHQVHKQKGNRQKGFQTKGPKNTNKRATDKKDKKADKRAKNQSYISIVIFSMKKLFFQYNKTDVELDLFKDVSIFVV